MKKPNVTKFLQTMSRGASKHSPEILTGLGVAGMVTTVILAVKATPKAIQLIDEARHEKQDAKEDQTEKLTLVETVKAAWKPYIPTVITGTASIACIIGASSVNARRNAALTAAYQLSTTALSEYKEKVVETIGEKKERTVREKVAQEKVSKIPVDNREIIITKKGETQFFEPLSGRYFKSDVDEIKRIVNELNKRMIGGEQYVSLTEFYIEIGLPGTIISDSLGWNVCKDVIELEYPAVKADDGSPCLSLDYLTRPEYDFDKLY